MITVPVTYFLETSAFHCLETYPYIIVASMPSTGVLLFGDQTLSPAGAVKELYDHSRQSVLLKSFLHNSSVALHAYAEDLGTPTNLGASFTNALNLAEQYAHQQENSTVIMPVLLCIAQLGSVILHSEQDPSLFGDTTSVQHAVGLCTGLISAATFAAATSTAHLVQMSSDVVSLTMRIGIEAHWRSAEVEPGTEDWTLAVTKLPIDTAQNILKTFNATQVSPVS